MSIKRYGEQGATLVELVISLTVLAMIMVTFFGLFTALVNSTVVAKQKAIAASLATNQMEYLKSLPYNSLAIEGGSIYSATPLPAAATKTVDGVVYTTRSSINYIDDAFDGCANYPTPALKQLYCRSYPPPAGAPAVDTNPQDYKVIHVSTYNAANKKLAEVDTQVSARVAETASTTGALFVTVLKGSGDVVSDATVTVVNNALAPAVSLSDTTDSNGVAIFYGLPPDISNFNYVITASKSGYSTLATLVPSGSLQPTYPNQKVFTQQSSSVTLTIKPQATYGLVIETTDTSGSALASAKVYLKGGYKKYTATTDTAYYFDNLTPSDTRPTTDASGLAGVLSLVPGPYIFCGDVGATSCSIGGTTYYLAAAVPYIGYSSNPFYPLDVPIYDPASPPTTVFPYNGNSFVQKVRLMLTTSSSFPRIHTLTPDDVSLSTSTLTNYPFQITGDNLPCGAVAASCGTTVHVVQGANTFVASCTGPGGSLQLDCTVNLTGIVAGGSHLVISAAGNTLTTPDSPLMGGFNVTP